MTLSEFCIAVVRYCDVTGGSVTSWKRSVQHNAAVGGVVSSPHLLGFGADIVYDSPHSEDRLTNHLTIALGFGLTLIHESLHDHLQPRGWR